MPTSEVKVKYVTQNGEGDASVFSSWVDSLWGGRGGCLSCWASLAAQIPWCLRVVVSCPGIAGWASVAEGRGTAPPALPEHPRSCVVGVVLHPELCPLSGWEEADGPCWLRVPLSPL